MANSKGQRKEQRIAGCKPVTVSGQDMFGNPFSQNTFTVEIAAHGARLRGLPPLNLGAILLLECGGRGARYRVVWIGEKGGRYDGHVGLATLDLDKPIFGIKPSNPGSFYDEYIRVEAELHRSEERYRSLFENALGMIYAHDMRGLLLSMNPAAARSLGWQAGGIVKQNLADFLAPSIRNRLPQYFHRLEEAGQDSGHALVMGHDRGRRVWMYRNLVVRELGCAPYVVGHAMDVSTEKQAERRQQRTLRKLQIALDEVKTLKGLLPSCAWCKRIRTETGEWTNLESYVAEHSEANFSHGICPECLPKFKEQNSAF